MLYDLTRVSGERVKQVDELHVGGRVWITSTNLFLLLGGAAMGGEVNQRRWDKWRDRHGQPDHEFILPGNPEPFLPNQREIVLWHCHPYKP